VCYRCGDPTHHAGTCHWSNETINEDSEQRLGFPTLNRWGTNNANPANAGPAAPNTPASANGAQAWGTPTTAAGSQVNAVSTPELATITSRLQALETGRLTNRTNLLAAMNAQAEVVDAGFEEVRHSQATAVAGLQSSISRNITTAVRSASEDTNARLNDIMRMMSQITGIPIGTAAAQIGGGPQPQIGNGNGAGLPQITLAGHNFATPQDTLPAPPQASATYLERREQARLAMQRAGGDTLAGAPDVLDGHTDPVAGAAGQGTTGTPQ